MSRLSRFGVVILAAVVLGQVSANAATSPPFSFDDLVARADVIFIGEVTDVRPFPLETREGMVIKTRVTFRVSDPIWGTTRLLEVFDFIGGKWDRAALQETGGHEALLDPRKHRPMCLQIDQPTGARNRRVIGAASSRPRRRKLRTASESAARHAMPRSESIPSK